MTNVKSSSNLNSNISKLSDAILPQPLNTKELQDWKLKSWQDENHSWTDEEVQRLFATIDSLLNINTRFQATIDKQAAQLSKYAAILRDIHREIEHFLSTKHYFVKERQKLTEWANKLLPDLF